jgi:hypothetical protein
MKGSEKNRSVSALGGMLKMMITFSLHAKYSQTPAAEHTLRTRGKLQHIVLLSAS